MTLPEDEFAVLNAVYLRKIASPDVIAQVSGVAPELVGAEISRATTTERLEDVGGMYMLSDSGTDEVLAEYRARYEHLRTDADVLTWYQRFESINRQFLQAISAWQTDGGSDPGRLDRLLRLVERLIKSLAVIGATVPRYERYANRFRAAMDRIDAGSTEYVTSPTVDSVHNIWFEFHEDILTVIGRPRDIAEAQA